MLNVMIFFELNMKCFMTLRELNVRSIEIKNEIEKYLLIFTFELFAGFWIIFFH
jgi:hypothetical protein